LFINFRGTESTEGATFLGTAILIIRMSSDVSLKNFSSSSFGCFGICDSLMYYAANMVLSLFIYLFFSSLFSPIARMHYSPHCSGREYSASASIYSNFLRFSLSFSFSLLIYIFSISISFILLSLNCPAALQLLEYRSASSRVSPLAIG